MHAFGALSLAEALVGDSLDPLGLEIPLSQAVEALHRRDLRGCERQVVPKVDVQHDAILTPRARRLSSGHELCVRACGVASRLVV